MEIKLTEEQKLEVKRWVGEGMGLSDIQKRLSDEFGISATYMAVRFLVIDLGVDIAEPDEPEEPEDEARSGIGQDSAGGLVNEGGDPVSTGQAGSVSVELDRVTKPGTVVSGSVVFSDGQQASWSLDQLGRLALSASDPDYRPSEEDIALFQDELRKALEKRGF